MGLIKHKFILNIIIFGYATIAQAAWTTIPVESKKADEASAKIEAKTKNVNALDIIKLSEALVSTKDYEKLMKESKKAKQIQIESLMFGDDFFYLKAGPIKVVFKWIDKDNVAFKLNGHSFSYEEASKTELWQKKVVQVIKNYQSPGDVYNVGAFMLLPLLFNANSAEAFNIDWKSKWTWTVIGAVVVTLVANHFYKKHKKKHNANKAQVRSRLAQAKANLAAAEARGEQNLTSYAKAVADLENLLAEYNSTSDVGFFGFLFGNRISKPAMYDSIMTQPASTTGTGVPGEPTAPPTNSTTTYDSGAF